MCIPHTLDGAEHTVLNNISPLQVKVSLQPRRFHSSSAISITSTVTEVIMFGGASDFWGDTIIADTAVLQFSKWCRFCKSGKGGGELSKDGADTGVMGRSVREGNSSCDEVLALHSITE